MKRMEGARTVAFGVLFGLASAATAQEPEEAVAWEEQRAFDDTLLCRYAIKRQPDGTMAREGRYEEYHVNGEVAVRGKYSRGERTGTWVYYDSAGQQRTRGKFRNRVRMGRWATWNALGKLDRQPVDEDLLPRIRAWVVEARLRAAGLRVEAEGAGLDRRLKIRRR